MVHAVVLPKMGMTMVEGTITEWFVKAGDPVQPNDSLFSFETEKVDFEVEAEISGNVHPIVGVDDTVDAGSVVAYILLDGEEVPEDHDSFVTRVGDEEASPSKQVSGSSAALDRSPPVASASDGPVKASPVAKRLAAENNIDLSNITGSGPGGRIVKADVEKEISGKSPYSTSVAESVTARMASTLKSEVPYRGMRRTIGTRMHESLANSAQLTISMDVDMTDVVKLRSDLIAAGSDTDPRVTYTDLIIKAVAGALRLHPRVNAILDGDVIRTQPGIHIGMAVALEEGLIVPVIRDSDSKSIYSIAAESTELAEKARQGALNPDDLTGGTFTVTSLGMFDVDVFTPIINAPQAAILGIGRIVDRPVFLSEIGTQIERRSFATLSLTIDHRILDGAHGSQFLLTVRKFLEHPYRLIAET